MKRVQTISLPSTSPKATQLTSWRQPSAADLSRGPMRPVFLEAVQAIRSEVRANVSISTPPPRHCSTIPMAVTQGALKSHSLNWKTAVPWMRHTSTWCNRGGDAESVLVAFDFKPKSYTNRLSGIDRQTGCAGRRRSAADQCPLLG